MALVPERDRSGVVGRGGAWQGVPTVWVPVARTAMESGPDYLVEDEETWQQGGR
ncbi:hypothetical protein ACWDX6_25465 [Streptomyces sp. NPDC003027]